MGIITEIVKKKKGDIEAPPTPPVGHYRFEVMKPYDHIVPDSGDWEFVNITCVAKAAQDDIDPEELAAYGSVEKVISQVKFIIGTNPDPVDVKKFEARLQEFLDCLGLDVSDEDSLEVQLGMIVGNQFIGNLVESPNKNDPTQPYNRIVRYVSLEDCGDYQ